MSSPYQILDDRSIDQWKVTELKEELRKRRLTISGLKQDLVKRLDEAVRIERENAQKEFENAQRELENAQKEVDNGLNSDSVPVVSVKNSEPEAVITGTNEANLADSGKKTGNVDGVSVQFDINSNDAALDQVNIEEGYVLVGKDSTTMEEGTVVHTTTSLTSMAVTEILVSDVTLSEQEMKSAILQEPGSLISQLENEVSKPQMNIDDSKPQVNINDPNPQVNFDDSKPHAKSYNSEFQLGSDNANPQLENDSAKPPKDNDSSSPTPCDVVANLSALNSQVSEVSPVLGSEVKYDYISTDSVSINENFEIKDNIIADHVKLELNVNKSEMVEPPPSTVPVGGGLHPIDVEEPLEHKASVEEKDDNNGTSADLGKKNDNVDVGYSEKLNLDRSSGDDSLEEELESRQVDSKYSSDNVGGRSEKTEVHPGKDEDTHVDIMGNDFSVDKVDLQAENNDNLSATAEKRKHNDQLLASYNEPFKRQRRWNSESLKDPEPQGSNPISMSAPRDSFSSVPKRIFSRSDSTVSEDATKERVVPPSAKPPTSSLRIDHFLRPFTLKAVQELLGKTGEVTDFWMDHIKTHCYVTYSSIEEAMETRNAVYNLQWPPNGGRLLIAEFVDPQEVKAHLKIPQTATASASASTAFVSPMPPIRPQSQPSPRHLRQQLQLPPPPSLPPPPPMANPPPAREQLPPPPSLPEKVDPPIVTLDDLFRKTKATPRIYYLPLSDEQVAAKLAAQGKNTKQSAGLAPYWKGIFQLLQRNCSTDGFGVCIRILCYEAMTCLVELGTLKLRTLHGIMLLCGQTIVANLVLLTCLNLTSNERCFP